MQSGSTTTFQAFKLKWTRSKVEYLHMCAEYSIIKNPSYHYVMYDYFEEQDFFNIRSG